MKMKTAPMGWNSWDCYGASVNEEIVRKNAEYMAKHLKKYGYETSSGMSQLPKATNITPLQRYAPMNTPASFPPKTDSHPQRTEKALLLWLNMFIHWV